jgi:cyanophycinase-like exopeptidase
MHDQRTHTQQCRRDACPWRRRAQQTIAFAGLFWLGLAFATFATAATFAHARHAIFTTSTTNTATTNTAISPIKSDKSPTNTDFTPAAELLLIGGGMSTCSSMSPTHCNIPNNTRSIATAGQGPTLAKRQSLIALDDARIARAIAPEYWSSERLHIQQQLALQLRRLQQLSIKNRPPQSSDSRLQPAPLDIAQFETWFRQLPALSPTAQHSTVQHSTAQPAEHAQNSVGNSASLSGDALWQQLATDEFDRMLDALEYIPSAGGQRIKEQVWLSASRDQHSMAIYQHMISAALARPRHQLHRQQASHQQNGDSQQPPLRILFLTVASRDPFAAVDFYQQALTQAAQRQRLPPHKIEVRWLPLSAALMQLQHDKRHCDQLALALAAYQGSFFRQHAYPDLFAQMQQLCRAGMPQAVAEIEAADVIFFNGGDQQLSKMAFYQPMPNGRWQPSPALMALQQRYWQGELLVVGTSAGTAVQSGAIAAHQPFFATHIPRPTLTALTTLKPPMIRGGDSEQALWQNTIDVSQPALDAPPNAFISAPQLWQPEESYRPLEYFRSQVWRSQQWHTQQALHQLSFDRAGGLGLFPWGMLDTHFSERGRELRLIRMLHDSQTALGFGIDEATALQVKSRIQRADDTDLAARIDMAVLGAGGVFIADVRHTHAPLQQVQVHYLPSGAAFHLDLAHNTAAQSPTLALRFDMPTVTSAPHPAPQPAPQVTVLPKPSLTEVDAEQWLFADGFRQFSQHWCQQQALPASAFRPWLTPAASSEARIAVVSPRQTSSLHTPSASPPPTQAVTQASNHYQLSLRTSPQVPWQLPTTIAIVHPPHDGPPMRPHCQYQHGWLSWQLTPL